MPAMIWLRTASWLAVDEEPQIITWSLVLIAALIALFTTVNWLRKKLTGKDPIPGGGGFTLGELRDLYRQGQITQEQFERAKARVVEQAGRPQEKPKENPPDVL